MMKMTVRVTGLDAFTNKLKGMQRQIPYAVQTAVNNTAFDVRKRLGAETGSRLDKPTKYTTGAFRVEKATKANLTAKVFLSDQQVAGASPADLLSQQFAGGTRKPKRYEVALRQSGLLGASEYTVPGSGVTLDAYGNVVRSQLLQILKALKGGTTTTKGKRKSKTALAGSIFWATGTKGLPKGAWVRQGRMGLKPLLLVVRQPTYRQRVPFLAIAKDEIEKRWPINVQAAIARAIATAR